MHSAIYQGELRHRRFHPKHHEFSYQSTLFYIDLDELPQLFDGVRGWSLNKRNFGSFLRTDYLGDPQVSLRDAVKARVTELAGACVEGPIRMLTNLRILGCCFNPVTFYYLFEQGSNAPKQILAEVNNTPWNERHSYLIPCDELTGKTKTLFDKTFHVSPFNPLDMRYRWVSSAPGESLLVHMENLAPPIDKKTSDSTENICHMDATLSLKRYDWSASRLQRLILSQPWAAIKVPFSIYWQALRLFIKGAPVYSHKTTASVQSLAELKTTGEKS
jgi:hypothetical protein